MSGNLEHAQELLRKAGSDLFVAETIAPTGRAADAVCFHAQQAAEKSLKALAALAGREYPYSHDMAELAAFVSEVHPLPPELVAALIPMTRFAVHVRYEESEEAGPEEMRAAIDAARTAYALAGKAVLTEESPCECCEAGEDQEGSPPSEDLEGDG